MKSINFIAAIIVVLLGIGGLYTNCGTQPVEDAATTTTTASAPLPSFTIGCTTSSCTALSAGSYDVYVFFMQTSSCASTSTSSTATVKGKLSGTSTGNGLTTGLSGVTWYNNDVSTIKYGSYTEWSWVDTNSNGQLDIQEPYVCSVLTVDSPSLGNRSLSSYSFATSNQPALSY